VPGGPAFAIIAERYRFQGKISVDLAAQMEPHARLQGASGSFSPESTQPFSWSAEQGCSKHPSVSWSILYGLLRDPSDHAYAYTGARMHTVLTAPIPPSIHLAGALGYAVLRQAPSRLLVRDRAGKIIQDERWGSPSKEPCNADVSSLVVLQNRSQSTR
jgi:hypothetical protein